MPYCTVPGPVPWLMSTPSPEWYSFFACNGMLSSFCLPGLLSGSVLLASMMDPRSEQAERIYRLTNYFFIAAGFILLLVTVLTFLFVWKYRARKGDGVPSPMSGNRKLETIMIGVPLAMVALFFYLTVTAMNDINPDSNNAAPDVVITGHQWWWEVTYPKYGASTANEVYLPAGRKILIRLTSADVIHDWWVPQLGNKMDMIPGSNNHIWLTIKQPGFYEGACSEFCGQQHAWMRIRVYARPQAEFLDWIKGHRQPAKEPATLAAGEGMHLFNTLTCGNCHSIRGTDASGTAGPELTHMASRQTLLTGMLPNTPENLNRWLNHPQQVKPGAYMPDFLLDKRSRDALVAYLTELK